MTSHSASPAVVGGRPVSQAATALLIALSLALVLMPSISPRTSSDGGPYADLVDQVSGDRIMATVGDLQDFGSRAYNSSSMWDASIYIHDKLAELGLWVTYQDFGIDGLPQRNVIAVLNGTDPTAPQYLFGAHYDSITSAILGFEEGDSSYAPGADDDASGVAATIELASVLHGMELNSTVKFVAFGAEETGLNGSDAFVRRERADGVLYAGTAIMDMIGYRDSQQNEIFVFRDSVSNAMAEELSGAVNDYGLNLSITFVTGTTFGYSDHYPFWLAGYPSMLVIEKIEETWPVNPHYHTVNDTADHLSEEQMEVVTKALLASMLELQNPDAAEEHNDYIVIYATIAIALTAIVILVYLTRRRMVEE